MSCFLSPLIVGLFVLSIDVSAVSLNPTSIVDESDLDRMKSAIQLSSPVSSNTLSNIYYSLLSKTLISDPITDSANICNHLKSQTEQTIESVYYTTSSAKLIGSSCQISGSQYLTKLEANLKEDASVPDIYRSAISLLNLGKAIDSTKVGKALSTALKKDESLLNTGLAFQLAAKLTKAEDRNVFVEKIGDVIVQADEVDGRYLQFEGGLGITASIILGVYQLATASNKPVGLTNDQALKFANYFLSRKYVLTPKGISEFLEVLKLYTNNKYHIPVVVNNYGSSALSPTNSVLTVRITNVLGASLGPMTVTADSALRVEDKKVAFTKKSLQAVQGDSKLFAINFLESKPLRGLYEISISAVPTKPDSRLIGNTGVQIKAIVLTQVSIVNAEITVADRDTGGSGAVTKLEFPQTISNPLEADSQQRLVLKFQLRDKIVGDLMSAQQTFVQLTNADTKQEIVFIAEPDSALTYKIDLNLQTRAKDLNHLNGLYEISLIVGDAVISNPIQWKIAKIKLQLSSYQSEAETPVSPFSPKPEIKHMFREPEKRPPLVISNAFSVLVMVPIVILFGLWFKIGLNFSGFPLTLSALIFHAGLALIFGLYICFFIKLNMFETCKYLAALGVITFLSGHSLLRRLAKNKK